MEKDKVARDKYGEWLQFCLSGKLTNGGRYAILFDRKKQKGAYKNMSQAKLIDIKKRRKTENRPSRKRKETVCWDVR